MKIAKLPYNESQRIQALHSYKCLDTEAEDKFDDLTSLACSLFDVPVAMITLVDTDRLWFKSKQGIQASEMPRDVGICSHAILGHRVLEVSDTLLDERFCDNPAVLEAEVRFYAGAPLVSSSGQVIGTFCICDIRPRELSFKDKIALKILAEHVMNLIERDRKTLLKKTKHQREDSVFVEMERALTYLNDQEDWKGMCLQEKINAA
jgi:GAF domain-containing protein